MNGSPHRETVCSGYHCCQSYTPCIRLLLDDVDIWRHFAVFDTALEAGHVCSAAVKWRINLHHKK